MIFFAFFIKFPISAPVPFKKPTPSQINLIKNAKNRFLLLKKIKKYPKCPAQVCWAYRVQHGNAMGGQDVNKIYIQRGHWGPTLHNRIHNVMAEQRRSARGR